MTLDPRISTAISDATAAHGQESTLADRLIGWLEGLASGNERLDDRDSVDRHIELLYDAVQVDLVDENED